jgi:PAS domain S-box-containing protein
MPCPVALTDPPLEAPPAAGRRVLVVDDEPAMREALGEGLADAGFAVETAEAGEIALDRLRTTAVDAVLLDLHLPGMSGLETLTRLRAQDDRLPVIMVTGQATVETAVASLKQGAYDYVVKPFDLPELVRLVEHACERRRLHEELSATRELHEIAQAILDSSDLERLLERILDKTLAMARLDVGAVRLLNDTGAAFDRAAFAGYRDPANMTRHRRALFGPGAGHLVPSVLGSRGALVVPDVSAASGLGAFKAEGVRSAIIVPLLAHGVALGTMELGSREARTFAPAEVALLEAVGSQVGLAVQRSRLRDESRHADLERSAAEEARARLAAVLEATPDLVIITDRTGRRSYMNRAGRRLLGLPETGDAQLGTLLEHRPDWARTLIEREAIPTATRRGVWRGEAAFVSATGQEIPTAQVLLAHRNAAGEVESFSEVAQDTRERKALEAQLREAQKFEAVGQLAAGVAHDFNNLLTAITGYAEVLLDRLPEGAPLHAEVQEIRRAGDRAAAITRQLLAFGRRQLLKPEVLDLDGVVADIERMLGRLIPENVRLLARATRGLGWVNADRGQLEQVLVNLVVNARDAMATGGTLTIETANVDLDDAYARRHVGVRPGRYVMLAVSDTGHGMDAATQARIFEPFFTTKPVGRGTGLGLSTVYGIVKQSGGSIWVYSEPGRGTTFKIYLPRVDAAPAASGRAVDQPRAEGGTGTVLLVEDEESVLGFVRHALAELGYTVLTARDGAEALRVADAHPGPIDLLLTDLIMPELGGVDTAAALRERRPAVRLVFMSGYASEAARQAGGPAADAPFLSKPFTRAILARTVREALDRPARS